MKLEKQLIMIIGMTQNNWELTREMIDNSLDSFANKPIVWNEKQNFKDYRDMENYKQCKVIGMICEEANILIENNNVYADILLFDRCCGEWKGKFDNWRLTIDNDWKSFKLDSIEVF
jgi:hypothetical protein